jgi:hypothetical protein
MRLHVNASVLYPLFGRVVRELARSYGVVESTVLFYGHDGVIDLAEVGSPAPERVLFLTDAIARWGAGAPDMDYIRRCEQEYGFPHLHLIITGDRFLSKMPHERALKLVEVGFRLVEETFDTNRPDAVFSDPVACFLSHIQYRVALKRGIPFLTMTGGRLDNRFVVIRNYLEQWDSVTECFTQLKREPLRDDWRAEAEEFLRVFRGKQVQPEFATVLFQAPGFELATVRLFATLLKRRRLDPHNHLLTTMPRAIVSRLSRVAKGRLLDRAHFERPMVGERFVFFPLHFQPELTTLTLAPFHLEQLSVVENIAKALPLDHRLYVKEHPSSIGRRPMGYYRRLRQIPNVRLIAPEVKSHALLASTSAVCTIAGTVGWEAVFYQKPVITFGEVNYNAFDEVQHVRAWQDLPAAIHHAIYAYKPDTELLLKWIAANLHGAYEGDIGYAPGMSPPCLEPPNITRLARAVAQELGLAPKQLPLTTAPYRFAGAA